jgi:hypothetical protein
MKKLFILASMIFVTSVFFSFEESKLVVEKNALADGGTCCPEDKSICKLLGHTFNDHYYRGVGSCASDPPSGGGLEEITLN